MSRLFSALAAFGSAVALPEVTACVPYVTAALNEVPVDLKAADPASALLNTAKSAYAKMKADPSVVPSLTGIMALLGGAAMDGYSAYLSAPADDTAAQSAALVAGVQAAPPVPAITNNAPVKVEPTDEQKSDAALLNG